MDAELAAEFASKAEAARSFAEQPTLPPGDKLPTIDSPHTPLAAEQPGKEPALPTIPGYEILGVLGRGGMGVVSQDS